MEFLVLIGKWFAQNILTKPEFFVGLLVFFGYLFMGKKIYEAVGGFIKATVGYMILNVGAKGLVVTFRPILEALGKEFHLKAAVIDPYFGLQAVEAALKTIGQTTASVMTALLIGFILNILLVLFRKITKIRTLFITGHIMQQQAQTATWMLFFLLPQFRNITGVVLIGIFVGIYWAVGSNLSVEPTQRLTENAGFAIGHQQMFAVWVADKLAPKLGNPKKRLDDLKLPKWLSMLHDDIISTGLIMLIFFGGIMLVLGPNHFTSIKGGDIVSAYDPKKMWFGTYVISTTLSFAVYLTILKTGVRMFVSELTVSFQGISNKILPGSFPAVDCAATYGFGSPSAVLFGFLVGTVAQFISIALLLIFKSPIFIITGFVPVFFDNATIAVFADKRGGARAALILSALSGVLQVFLGAIAVLLFGLSDFGGWHGNIDQSTLWVGQGFVMKYLGIIGYVLVIVAMLLIPQIQYAKSKNKEQYYEGTVDLEEV